MKKILVTILLAITLLPSAAAAQTWVEPSMQNDGTFMPGHWSTKGDNWQKLFTTPGNMNPFTGQFNTYGRKPPLTSSSPPSPTYTQTNPMSTGPNSHYIPGSTGPNPYLIPGSSAPNPYATLRSNPNQPVQQKTGPGRPQ